MLKDDDFRRVLINMKLLEILKTQHEASLVLVPHWDADGVASAALLANVAKRLNKGIQISLRVPKDGRYRIKSILEDLDPESSVVVTLDLALPEDEISWLMEKFPMAFYIDHHQNLAELAKRYPERVISKEAPSNTLLLERLLEDSGVELSKKEKVFVKLGAICDRVSILVTDPLLGAKFLGSEKTILDEAVTLINSEYRAFWTVEASFSCLLNRSVTDIVFNRYPECERLHEARRRVSAELSKLLKTVRLVDLEPILYAEIHSELYIHGLLATVLMLKNKGAPVLVSNIKGSLAYLQLRTRINKVDFGKIFFELGKQFSVEAGGHRDGAGAVVPLERLDEFLEALVSMVREKWQQG